MLDVRNAVLGYRKKQEDKVVLDKLCFCLSPGELLCVLGANGAGKTTLYRTILGFIPLLGGQIMIDGCDMSELSRMQLARKIAYVPQYHTPPFPYTVFDVVLMGRNTHMSQFAAPGKRDVEIAEEMIERMDIAHLRNEVYTEISGGERQMVLIARALTQQSEYILMDEPTASLDFGNQIKVLRMIRKLADDGMGVCFTSHNPSHALQVNASVLAIESKRNAHKGPAREVVTARLLKDMYGVEAKVCNVGEEADDMNTEIIVRI